MLLAPPPDAGMANIRAPNTSYRNEPSSRHLSGSEQLAPRWLGIQQDCKASARGQNRLCRANASDENFRRRPASAWPGTAWRARPWSARRQAHEALVALPMVQPMRAADACSRCVRPMCAAAPFNRWLRRDHRHETHPNPAGSAPLECVRLPSCRAAQRVAREKIAVVRRCAHGGEQPGAQRLGVHRIASHRSATGGPRIAMAAQIGDRGHARAPGLRAHFFHYPGSGRGKLLLR